MLYHRIQNQLINFEKPDNGVVLRIKKFREPIHSKFDISRLSLIFVVLRNNTPSFNFTVYLDYLEKGKDYDDKILNLTKKLIEYLEPTVIEFTGMGFKVDEFLKDLEHFTEHSFRVELI